MSIEGILLVDKPSGRTSFSLVSLLRKRFQVQKIGHAGTLDPFATGVMVMLVGKRYTTLSNRFLTEDKEYEAEIHLGVSTDTYDRDGSPVSQSDFVPSLEEVHAALSQFQGTINQIPPMYSAKKHQGKKFYELARKGITIEREPVSVHVQTTFLSYEYPKILVRISCSKGTYIRSIAHDLGNLLGCGAHLTELKRTRCGNFHIADCVHQEELLSLESNLVPYLKKL